MAPGSRQPRRHRRNANEPGHAHELTFSCYRRYPFLSRDRVCEWLVESIDRARKSLEFDVWAWVFMPEHVHLIIHPRRPTYDMAAIRRQIKEPVARQALAWRPSGFPSCHGNGARGRSTCSGNRVVGMTEASWKGGGVAGAGWCVDGSGGTPCRYSGRAWSSQVCRPFDCNTILRDHALPQSLQGAPPDPDAPHLNTRGWQSEWCGAEEFSTGLFLKRGSVISYGP